MSYIVWQKSGAWPASKELNGPWFIIALTAQGAAEQVRELTGRKLDCVVLPAPTIC
jgi:hypothetical protein